MESFSDRAAFVEATRQLTPEAVRYLEILRRAIEELQRKNTDLQARVEALEP